MWAVWCTPWTVPLFSVFVSSLTTSFLPLFPTPPSILFIPVLKFNTLLDQERRVDDKWRVIIYLFLPLQAQTACSLWWSFTTCIHYTLSVLFLSFPICQTLVVFQFAFYYHNLTSFSDLSFSCFIFIFCVVFFLFFISRPIPFLPHRSGCNCGTRQDKSDFVVSSRVTSETLLLLS